MILPALPTTDDLEVLAWRTLASLDRVSIWDWQCRHGRIPAAESGKPGRWLGEKAKLFKKALDVVSARLQQRSIEGDPFAILATLVLFVGPSQIGKTKSFLHPIIAYTVDCCQTNLAFVTHKEKEIRKHQRTRLLPMFEETPRLNRYLPQSQRLREQRLAGSLWQLEVANLHMISANRASNLREYSHQVGVGDEVEAWQLNVDGEGSPVQLFLDRQKRYEGSSILALGTTPNLVIGHGWAILCSGSHERLLVRCEHCGHDQDLDVDGLRCTREGATPDQIHLEDLAHWHCAHCDHGHDSDAVDRIVDHAIRLDRWTPGTWAQTEDHPDGHWTPATRWRLVGDDEREAEPCGRWRRLVDTDTGEVLLEHWQLIDCDPPSAQWRTYHCTYLHDTDCSNGRFLAHERSAQSSEDWHAHVTGWRAEPIITSGEALTTDELTDSHLGGHRYGEAPDSARWLVVICDQQGNSRRTCWFAYSVWAIASGGGEAWLVEAGDRKGWNGLQELEESTWSIGGDRRRPDKIFCDGANHNMDVDLKNWVAADYARLRAEGHPPKHARARLRRLLLIGDVHLPADLPWREQHPTSRTKAHHPEGCRIFRWSSLHYKDLAHDRLKKSDDHAPLHLPLENAEQIPRDLKRFLRSCTSEERVFRQVGGPGGRKRAMFYWQARVWRNSRGQLVERSDTHWWDTLAMMEVACDLLGARRRLATPPKAPGPPPPSSQQRQLTSGTRRKVSRLEHRRKR